MSDGRRIAKNSIFLYVLTFSNYFVGLLLFPYISRVLTIEGFGLVGFGMAYALVFQSIVEFGFMISTTARISKSRADLALVSEIVMGTMLAKVLLSVVAAVAFLCSALFVPMVREHLPVISLFFLSAVATAMIPDFYFRGTEQMRFIAIRAIATKLFSIVTILVVVHSDRELAAIPASLFVGNLIAVCWAFISMRSMGIRFMPVKLSSALMFIKEGFMYFLSRISATINQSIGAFVLGLTYSAASQEMGVFAAAWRIASAGEMMLLPVSDSLYPYMINRRDYNLFWRVYSRGIIVWSIGCMLVFIFAHQICALILGPAYLASGDVLRILLFGAFMAFSSNMFGYNALAPIGLARHANLSILVSVAINISAVIGLLATHRATLTLVSVVVALSNVVIFVYRGAVFYKHRRLAGAALNKSLWQSS